MAKGYLLEKGDQHIQVTLLSDNTAKIGFPTGVKDDVVTTKLTIEQLLSYSDLFKMAVELIRKK